MGPLDTWIEKFLDRRGLAAPDGRALFKYRVAKGEFEELQAFFTNRFPRTTNGYAGFCLYAAEWWRRYGVGFRWEGLLESLALEVSYTELYEPVEIGLRYWMRNLRIGHSETGGDRLWRDFVGTMSREGGLPLQLLHGERSSVNRFFRHLLKERYASGIADPGAAEAAAYFLPEAWRHSDIYDLATELTSRVWELRESVKHAEDPIAELDRVSRGWHDDLPVVIDTDIAKLLVHGLVKNAHEIAAQGRPALALETVLRTTGGQCSLRRLIDLPRKLRDTQIRGLLGLDERSSLPRRLRLTVEAGAGPFPISVLTQWAVDTPYDLEFLAPAPVAVPGTGEVCVYADTREQLLGGKLLRGGEALEEVPWVFLPLSTTGAPDVWRLVSQGSARVRSELTMVVLPPSGRVVSAAQGEPAGELEVGGVRRSILIHSEGELRVEHAGETFVVTVAASTDETWSYELQGDRLDALGASDVWRGVPRMIAEAGSGLRRVHSSNELEWRARGGGRPWSPMSPACVGDVELRYAPGGVTHVTKRAKIVPPETALSLLPRQGANRGGLRILGSHAARASVIADDCFSASSDVCSDGFEWTFETLTESPASVSVELAWTDGRRLRLTTPYPVAGVRFIDHEGRSVGPRATISFANLSRCRVESVLPHSDPAPVLRIRLAHAHDRSPAFVSESETSRPLRLRSRNNRALLRRYSLDLHEILDDVRLRIASSAEMNAYAKLTIESSSTGGAVLCVRRFAIAMRINEDKDRVVVLWDKSESHVDEEVERMEVRHVPISAPDADPSVLERRAPGEWALDADNPDAATRLVVGYSGDTCCARPIIWAPPSEDFEEWSEPAPRASTIEEAVRFPNTEMRSEMLIELGRRMAVDSLHPEWQHVLPFVRTLGTLPATTFDLLDMIVRVPTCSVFTLLAGQLHLDFHAVWTGLEDLSFAWDTVPVRDWIRGTRIWWEHSSRGLDGLPENTAAIVRESLLHRWRESADQISRRIPAFPLIREMVEHRVFGSSSATNSMQTMIVTEPGRSYFGTERETALQELLRAQANVDRWPAMDATRGLKNYMESDVPDYLVKLLRFSGTINRWQLSVVLAPVLAALASAWGVLLRPEQIFAIRQLRSFDVNWFQACHQFTLACAVGLVLEKDPEHYA